MPSFRTGTVERVVEAHPGLQVLEVRVGGELRPALLYPRYAAPAAPGDRVVVNTTAVDLGLGSGGFDIVVWNLAVEAWDAPSGGHIMKLRYTPLQSDVLAVEAPESPHHGRFEGDLGGAPVVAISVHSQLLPVVASLRARAPEARVAYVMTDGGALEAALSRTVRRMRELGWLCGVVTVGNAIGGDLEAVNLYSGLAAARAVLGAGVVVCGMGPGVVGTGTRLGTTALEQGLIVNAAGSLGGAPVLCARMSGADPRPRHRGLDAHAAAAMAVALVPADVPVPVGYAPPATGRHRVVEVDCTGVAEAVRAAEAEGLQAQVMGRGLEEDPLFFLAAGAAGYHAAALAR